MGYLGLIGKVKDWLLHTIAWLWDNKSTVIIILLLYIATVLQYERNDLEQELEQCAVEKELLREQFEGDLLEMTNANQAKEIERLQKENEIEVRHSEQLSKMGNDYNTVIKSNVRLSDSLSKAETRLRDSDCETVRAYGNTVTELFRDSVGKYLEMGKIAQQHRVAEERAVNKYNTFAEEVDIKIVEEVVTDNK